MVENLYPDFLPDKVLNLNFHKAEPGYTEAHFDRLMTMDKVAIAMYGYLYDELDTVEKQDLVIAHCLGLDPPKGVPAARRQSTYPRGVPRSQRRI